MIRKIKVPLFIVSYKRADNILSLRTMERLGWAAEELYVCVDDETPDLDDYRKNVQGRATLLIFSAKEARRSYDYVTRSLPSGRSAGQARNMVHEMARNMGIRQYVVMDDDTEGIRYYAGKRYIRKATAKEVRDSVLALMDFMERRHIGVWGFSQTGDMVGREDGLRPAKLLRMKVMNFVVYDGKYFWKGERGAQDEDTAMYMGLMAEGLLCGSMACGCVLVQVPSATQKGGLTDLYKQGRLLHKAIMCVIQHPSCCTAKYQKRISRLHHFIRRRYEGPVLMKVSKGNNIAWDTYPEDTPYEWRTICERNDWRNVEEAINIAEK